MGSRFTVDEIRDYWTRQATEHGQSPASSWSDECVIEMEVAAIHRWLADGDRVADIGCATGYSTVQLAREKDISILGLDYVPEMIDEARKRLEQSAATLRGRVEFGVGDITALDLTDAAFDKVVVVRVVINLGDWEQQIRGLRECARVLKPGGLLLLSEATVQGWQKLNAFRNEWGLPDIPMPSFNLYLDQKAVVDALSDRMEIVEILDFASTYYVGTRVFKPLLIKALGADMDVADPDMEWNRWFSTLPAAGNYGTQKLFVLRKR